MNAPDSALDRLFRSAALAPDPAPPAPLGFATRVAALAREPEEEDAPALFPSIFPRALFAGFLVMALSFLYNFEAISLQLHADALRQNAADVAVAAVSTALAQYR